MIIVYSHVDNPGWRAPMFPVRWRRGDARVVRDWPDGLAPGHGATAAVCLECGGELLGPVTLVAVGPTDDEERERHDAGRWYTAGGALIHTECVDLFRGHDGGRYIGERD